MRDVLFGAPASPRAVQSQAECTLEVLGMRRWRENVDFFQGGLLSLKVLAEAKVPPPELDSQTPCEKAGDGSPYL